MHGGTCASGCSNLDINTMMERVSVGARGRVLTQFGYLLHGSAHTLMCKE